ncbi:hypothetical protein PIB30_112160, partial [Stylosanthes scabra]|nr:hypothetical protein [Stylosanthes scabra]
AGQVWEAYGLEGACHGCHVWELGSSRLGVPNVTSLACFAWSRLGAWLVTFRSAIRDLALDFMVVTFEPRLGRAAFQLQVSR